METINSEMESLIRKFFPQLSDLKLRKAILETATLREVKKGDILIDYGTYVKMIPLVVEGCIKVTRQFEDGRELFLYHLYPGDSCAISVSCCMSAEPSPFFAIAEDDSKIIGIPTELIDQWQAKFPVWNRFMIAIYEDRFKELVLALDDVAFKKLDERLMDYLRKKTEAQNSLKIEITHQQIAEELNTARETISRLLKSLESKKYLSLGRNTIELKRG
jgi:CRP/FNR family transcriptional regulator, anaerobic regulatory protein